MVISIWVVESYDNIFYGGRQSGGDVKLFDILEVWVETNYANSRLKFTLVLQCFFKNQLFHALIGQGPGVPF